ncbi:MAG: rhomboid family intramembrane serine protease [Acidimicrobiales bacterium]|nr:rhomboid family intramembrane serine protease [Acidimicrobiales bacterium]
MAAPGAPSPPTTPPRPALSDIGTPYLVVLALVAAMWVEELVDLLPRTQFDGLGIRPRQVRGLAGIPLAPFLHDGFGHLLGNTIPFLVLGCLIAASGTQRFVQVFVISGLVAGIGTWLTAPAGTVHIGASGVVFGFLTYLIARAAFERRLGHVLLALAVLAFYGGLLWGLLPRPGISWQGHLFGSIGGVAAAWVIHGRRKAPAEPA